MTLADVDADGRPDLLLQQQMAISNGMGVAYGRLCTWASAGGGSAMLCRDVEEWGSLSVLVLHLLRKAGACR